VELPVGVELVWDLWNDKSRIPQWMPEIQAVEVGGWQAGRQAGRQVCQTGKQAKP
jgi:uncharacterized membrane protein